jgi:hypothetical protein
LVLDSMLGMRGIRERKKKKERRERERERERSVLRLYCYNFLTFTKLELFRFLVFVSNYYRFLKALIYVF